MQSTGKPDSPIPPDAGRHPGRALDNIFSFILRVRLDPVPGGNGPRPQFKLEDVSAAQEWRFTDFQSAAECLAKRVEAIIHGSDPG